jgi:electron transport complex protein RnfD
MSDKRKFELHAGPFLHAGRSTRGLMAEVLLALVPVVLAAVWFFGVAALLSVAVACAGAMLTERALSAGPRGISLRDGSAAITGVMLALTLPPSLPLWMGFLGGAFGIGAGKLAFGGLGQNPFNPALVGRAFLQAAFPGAVTHWTRPFAASRELLPSVFTLPFTKAPAIDAVKSATPLGMAKFEHQLTPLSSLFWGNVAGSLGETSAALLLIVGGWLAIRRVFDYRLCLSTLLSTLVTSALFHLAAPSRCPEPLFMLLSGGVLFAAVFMATDPVTTPVTPIGAWIYGAGVGLLIVLIRSFGGLPEGVMYSVLLMNAVTPLIERTTQPKPFGATVRP